MQRWEVGQAKAPLFCFARGLKRWQQQDRASAKKHFYEVFQIQSFCWNKLATVKFLIFCQIEELFSLFVVALNRL